MPIQSPQLTLPTLPFGKFAFLLNAPVMLVIFALFFICHTIVSIVLFYHWSAYGMKHRGILVVEVLYTVVSVGLFAVASLALYYF